MTSRAHRPATGNAASCSSVHTSSRTSSRRGPLASTAARCSAACRGVGEGHRPVRLQLRDQAVDQPGQRLLAASRPSVTQYTRPRNRRSTRRSARTIFATVVLPNPPAPCTAVVIPTVPPLGAAALRRPGSPRPAGPPPTARAAAPPAPAPPGLRSYQPLDPPRQQPGPRHPHRRPGGPPQRIPSTAGNHRAVPPVATFSATASTVPQPPPAARPRQPELTATRARSPPFRDTHPTPDPGPPVAPDTWSGLAHLPATSPEALWPPGNTNTRSRFAAAEGRPRQPNSGRRGLPRTITSEISWTHRLEY